MDSSIIYRFLTVLLIFATSQVKAIEFQGKFLQGHYILGKTNPKAKIIVGKKEVKISKDGFFVFGIDRDRKFDLTFTKILDEKKTTITKTVLKRKYNIQRIDGLEESKVTPPESVYKRIKKENNAIGEARAINSDLSFFKDKFIMPVEGIISGVYGSQRILNGKPKWPHYGIDIAAKQGTMIKSSGAGCCYIG
jgi:murein DD-endopeptidase MepM/ murein hydrolase activator NlpD